MTVQGPSLGSSQAVQSAEAERSALNKVMWFGIIQLVGLIAGWIVYFYAFGMMFATASSLNLPPNPTPQQVSAALGPLFQQFTYVVPISLAIALVAILLLQIGFRGLSKVDSARFSVPSKLTFLLIIGEIIGGGAVVLLFNSIPTILAQAGSASGTPTAFSGALAGILSFALLALVGGVLALIGLIGGLILGLWRVGTRYDETIIKLGAIFVIIPLLNIVAPILVLVGASQAKRKVGTA